MQRALSARSGAVSGAVRDLAVCGVDLSALIADAPVAERRRFEATMSEILAEGEGSRPAAEGVATVYGEAVRRTGDRWLGLRLGATRGQRWLGPFGEAITHAPTLLGSIETARRFVGLMFDGTRLRLRSHESRCQMWTTLPQGLDPEGTKVVLQAVVVLQANLIDEFLQRRHLPLTLHFACPSPPPGTDLQGVRRPGRRLQFEAQAWGLEFPSAYLGLPRSVDDGSYPRLVAELEREARLLETQRDVVGRLRLLLLADLGHSPQLAEAARSMRMSPRSLQLHLAERGLSFQEELTEVRLAVARRYLAETDEPITVIAAHVGYRSAEAFCRFFRAATGESPRAHRQRAVAGHRNARPRRPSGPAGSAARAAGLRAIPRHEKRQSPRALGVWRRRCV